MASRRNWVRFFVPCLNNCSISCHRRETERWQLWKLEKLAIGKREGKVQVWKWWDNLRGMGRRREGRYWPSNVALLILRVFRRAGGTRRLSQEINFVTANTCKTEDLVVWSLTSVLKMFEICSVAASARAGTIPGVGVARPTHNPLFGGVTLEWLLLKKESTPWIHAT